MKMTLLAISLLAIAPANAQDSDIPNWQSTALNYANSNLNPQNTALEWRNNPNNWTNQSNNYGSRNGVYNDDGARIGYTVRSQAGVRNYFDDAGDRVGYDALAE